MLAIDDDRGRTLHFHRPPRRVVSLVPSDTLTMFDLGAGDRVVGRTRYCEEPADRVAEVADIGGTKDPDVDAICALDPDLILANQEENSRPPLETLVQRGYPVFVSFPLRVATGIGHVARLAKILGIEQDPAVKGWIRRGYELLSRPPEATARRPRVLVPIWMDPLMTISGETFGSDMLALAGADNAFADRRRLYPLAADLGKSAPLPDEKLGGRDTRYPRLSEAEIAERTPDAVLLPDEPYVFDDEDVRWFRERCPIVKPCDGKDLFWYGTRSIDGVPRLRDLVASLRQELA